MRLSLQLYTLRNQLADDEPGTLQRARDIGYRYVETGGRGAATADYRKLLDDLGLAVSGIHAGIDQLETNLDQAIDEAKTLGSPFLIVPWLDESRRGNWADFGRQLSEIGAKVKAQGLTLAYHNHDFEFKNDGLAELYAAADADTVKAELDVAWVGIGGADPTEWIERLSGRLPLIHLKDYDPAKQPVWQSGGQGVIDWDSVLAAATAAGVEFGAVELDEYAGDPINAIRDSYRFFSSRGIV